MSEQKFQTRREFLPGIGHVVKQVPLGDPLQPGQLVVKEPVAPALPVALTINDVPLELALQVVEAASLVAVPVNFLTDAQREELKLPALDKADPPAPQETKAAFIPAEQKIAQVQQAETFEALNALMADETRKTVLAAAEVRANELKEAGTK
jgi:hypothetical protein